MAVELSAEDARLVEAWINQYPSEHTRDGYRRAIARLWKYGPSTLRVLEPTGAELRAAARIWYDRMLERGKPVSNNTYNVTVAAWNSFFKFLHQEDHIAKRPALVPGKKTLDVTTYPVPTEDDVNAVWDLLLNRVDPSQLDADDRQRVLEDRFLFALCICGGLRVSEICRMRRRDIDLDALVLLILGKGSKQRTVALEDTPIVRSIVTDACEGKLPGDLMFANSRGNQLKREQVSARVRLLFERSGCLATYTPHSLRAYLTTTALARGVESSLVQRQLGHSSFKTTQRYHPLALRVVPVGVGPREEKD